jgi:hypothetical protein
MNSIHITRRAAMALALLVLVTSASFAGAQGVGGATNSPVSKSSAEKSGEAPSSDVAATPSETEQGNPVETAEINALSDSSKPPSSSGGLGQEPPPPGPQSPSDGWQFQLSPYLFLAGMKGTVGIGGLTAQVDAPFRDIVKELNFGFMAAFEARKNKLLVLTDVMYMNLADSNALPGPLFSSVHADFKAFILAPYLGYRVAEKKGASLDVLGGIRYWHLSTNLDFRPGVLPAREVTGSKNWVDGVGGLKGKVHLSPRLFLTGLGDVGAGGSHITYQLFGGGGFEVSKKVALVIGYRYLKVDYDRDSFIFDMGMKGLLVGVTFKF